MTHCGGGDNHVVLVKAVCRCPAKKALTSKQHQSAGLMRPCEEKQGNELAKLF